MAHLFWSGMLGSMSPGMLSLRLGKAEQWVLGIAGAVLFFLLLGILYAAHGTFVYIQDDVYTHLSIARNLAQNGTWGITPGVFAPASSSPLWVLLLALGYFLFGGFAFYLPLILNVAFVLAIVLLMMRILKEFGVVGTPAASIVGLVALVTPLGPFAFGGMEHALQMFLFLLFLHTLSVVLTSPTVRARDRYFLYLLAPLITSVRYEGVFIIAGACVLLALRRRWIDAFAIALLGALPLALFGAWSVAQGGHFLPNTLLVKKRVGISLLQSAHAAASAAYLNIKTPLFMLYSVSLLFALHWRTRRDGSFWRKETVALALVFWTFLMQSVFAKLSWVPMFRYEAYLILAGTLYLLLCLRDLPWASLYERKVFSWLNILFFALLLLLATPLLRRAISWPYAVFNARDLYTITYQDAQFMQQKYPNTAVGAIDIGMMSYLGHASSVRVVDFWGLANSDVADAKGHGAYDANAMRTIAQKENIHVAALYDSWLGTSIPPEWPRVATWHINHNVTIGSDTLSFYAPTCADASLLEQNMRAFAPSLPPETQLTFLDWQSGCVQSAQRLTQ